MNKTFLMFDKLQAKNRQAKKSICDKQQLKKRVIESILQSQAVGLERTRAAAGGNGGHAPTVSGEGWMRYQQHLDVPPCCRSSVRCMFTVLLLPSTRRPQVDSAMGFCPQGQALTTGQIYISQKKSLAQLGHQRSAQSWIPQGCHYTVPQQRTKPCLTAPAASAYVMYMSTSGPTLAHLQV